MTSIRTSLLIRGGTVVNDSGARRADVRVGGDRITRVRLNLRPGASEQVIDAGGLWLLPGGIDPHAHLSCPRSDPSEEIWVDDFESGTRAALAGGITSVGSIAFPLPGETPLMTLERERAAARGTALTDVFFHPVLQEPTPAAIDSIDTLRDAGCRSLKIFMSSRDFDPGIERFAAAIRRAGQNGLVVMLHCEDFGVISAARDRLAAEHLTGLAHYAGSRPVEAEAAAVHRAIALAHAAETEIYIVHLSSRHALDACIDARHRGQTVHIETRPIYLHFTDDRYRTPDGPLFVGQPPLRTQADIDYLWKHLERGTIDVIASDHAPWTREQKMNPALTIFDLRPGMENLQTMLPVLFSEGVVQGRISPSRFVRVTSSNAARIFGLYPRKGTIREGSDADIALWDPEGCFTIRNEDLFSRAGHSVFAGFEGKGCPVCVIRHGYPMWFRSQRGFREKSPRTSSP